MQENIEYKNVTSEDVIEKIKIVSETLIALVPVFAAAFKSLKKIESYINKLDR